MPVPRKLLKAAFATLSAKSLRAAAEYHDLEDWKTRTPVSLVAELGDDDGNNLGTIMYDLKAPELRKVAKALGVEQIPAGVSPSKEDDLCSAIGTFLSEYDNAPIRAKAAKQAARLPGLTAKELLTEAASLQRPVLLLKPRGKGDPVAIWSTDQTRKVQGERLWISVDLRRHPDESLRRDGVLEVYADDAEGTGRATFRTGKLPRPKGKEIHLFGTANVDQPCLEVLFQKGSKVLQTWLDQMETHGWKLRGDSWGIAFPFHDVLDSYRRTWQAGHAFYAGLAVAQLGGWPLTWPNEGAEKQLRRPLVLRTYRASEPWVEVFQSGRGYQVRLRVT